MCITQPDSALVEGVRPLQREYNIVIYVRYYNV